MQSEKGLAGEEGEVSAGTPEFTQVSFLLAATLSEASTAWRSFSALKTA